VPDSIQAAPTGRAKCRGCGETIAKGELRFGESGASSYGEGETTSWFHLSCAALMRPDKLGPVLESSTEPLPEQAWLAECVRAAGEHPRLARMTRVERASSGRAHCRSCRELIAKGDFRFALQTFEEGRPTPLGTIHVECAEAYFGTADVLARARRLTELSEADAAELERALTQQRPGLAKATGAEAREDSETGSGSA
jgi:Poly(ADP-ribose) polymerase and DNA-Ligase Zn-finger region